MSIWKGAEIGYELPLDFFFSWSYIITTSITLPNLVKKLLRSVSVTFDGNPPKNTLG